LLLALSAQAASFDCGQAQMKVEHLICDNAELSKLDDDLSVAYKAALKYKEQADSIKLDQKQWIKKRNRCADISCLRKHYLRRTAELNETESYTLKMSKDDELCNHMLQLFNQDLELYGWQGDEHQEEHEEFKRIQWQPARFSADINGRTAYMDVQGASFDFNNDGIQDFVVRHIGSLSGMRADSLHVLDADAAKHANELVSHELWEAKNQIDLSGWWYNLSAPYEEIAGARVLEPFIYRGTSYLVMRPLFEMPPITSGYAVIAKYGSGKFINRDLSGNMEDICYYHRNRAKRGH
jgi:uncharacterized protein YecT (DUF1311 family)